MFLAWIKRQSNEVKERVFQNFFERKLEKWLKEDLWIQSLFYFHARFMAFLLLQMATSNSLFFLESAFISKISFFFTSLRTIKIRQWQEKKFLYFFNKFIITILLESFINKISYTVDFWKVSFLLNICPKQWNEGKNIFKIFE